MKRYRVDLSKQSSSNWNSDFVKDCKRCDCVFDVERISGHLVYLYKPGQHISSWNHRMEFGEFLDEPKPIDISIEKGLFEI
jgi:hypothetical protein